MNKSGASRSGKDKTFNEIGQEVSAKPRLVDHINYGIITSVDYNTYQVQIQLRDYPAWAILGKGYWPLLTQISDIFHRYGQLLPGMWVRVHWRGRQQAVFAVAELIGDETFDPFTQKDRKNDLPTLPFKLISGGLPL
jgi:hypothetical protein